MYLELSRQGIRGTFVMVTGESVGRNSTPLKSEELRVSKIRRDKSNGQHTTTMKEKVDVRSFKETPINIPLLTRNTFVTEPPILSVLKVRRSLGSSDEH